MIFCGLESLGRRRTLVKTVAMTSSVFVSGMSRLISVQAQEPWPSRPIRIVSAGSPGSTSDIFVGILEARLRERRGQSIILENKPGAGGLVAAGVVANSAIKLNLYQS